MMAVMLISTLFLLATVVAAKGAPRHPFETLAVADHHNNLVPDGGGHDADMERNDDGNDPSPGSTLAVGLHAQAAYSTSGFVVGSEITCRGLQSAFSRHRRVQTPVPIMYPGRHKALWRRTFDLVLVEGWFPSIGAWLHELRRNSPSVVILFFALDPGYPGMAALAKLDVDGFLTNSARAQAWFVARRFPAKYVPLAVDPSLFSIAVDADTRYGAIYVGAYVPKAQKRTLVWLLRSAAEAALNAGVPFAIYGYGWEAAPEDLRRHWRGVMPRDALGPAYCESTVVLCATANEQRMDGMINNRVFEALASGAVVVSDWFPELEDTFGDLLRYARTPQDAIRHVRAALARTAAGGADERTRRAAQHAHVRKHHTWTARVRDILAFRDELTVPKGAGHARGKRRRVRPARPRLLLVQEPATAFDFALVGALEEGLAGDYSVIDVVVNDDSLATLENRLGGRLRPPTPRGGGSSDPCAPYEYDVLIVSTAWRSPLDQFVQKMLAPYEARPPAAPSALATTVHPHLHQIRIDACHAARPRKALLLAPGSAPWEAAAKPSVFYDLIFYRTAWQLDAMRRYVVSAGVIRDAALQQVAGVSIATAADAIAEARRVRPRHSMTANSTWFDFAYVGMFSAEDRLKRLEVHPPRSATRATMHLGPAHEEAATAIAASLARAGTVVVQAPRGHPALARRTAHRLLARSRTVVLPATDHGGGPWLIQAWLAHVQQAKLLATQDDAALLNLSLENDNTKLVTHASLGVLDIIHFAADFRKGLSRVFTFGRAAAAVDVYVNAARWRTRAIGAGREDRAHITVPGNVTLRPLLRFTDFAVGDDGYWCLNVYARDPAAMHTDVTPSATLFSLCLMDDRSHLALFLDTYLPTKEQPEMLGGRIIYLQVQLKNAVFNDTTAVSNVLPICVVPPVPAPSPSCVGDWCDALDATPHMARQLRAGLEARAAKRRQSMAGTAKARGVPLAKDSSGTIKEEKGTPGVNGLVATVVNETLAHVGYRQRVLVYAVAVASKQQPFVACSEEGLFMR